MRQNTEAHRGYFNRWVDLANTFIRFRNLVSVVSHRTYDNRRDSSSQLQRSIVLKRELNLKHVFVRSFHIVKLDENFKTKFHQRPQTTLLLQDR